MYTYVNDHEELLKSLFGGKLPRNLAWSAVVELIGQVREVQPHGNDELAFVVGSQRGFLQAAPVPTISTSQRFPGCVGF